MHTTTPRTEERWVAAEAGQACVWCQARDGARHGLTQRARHGHTLFKFVDFPWVFHWQSNVCSAMVVDMEANPPLTALQALTDVGELLSELTTTAWSTLSHEQVLAAFAVIPQLRNRLDAVAGQLSIAVERGAVQSDGARTAAVWAGANTSAEPAEVRRDILTTKWLADYREFADAYESGVLSREHVTRLRKAETSATRSALVRDQEMIIGFAQDLGFKEFDVALQYWINAADPDGTIPNRQLAENAISLRRNSDGSLKISGQLDPLLGTTVYNAFNTAYQAATAADDAAGIQRTRAERRAHVFTELFAKGALREDGTIANPLLHIVLGQGLAEQILAKMADDTVELTPDMNDPDFRCEFIDGTPLHPTLAAATLGIATMRRIIFGAKSRDLDISHNTRAFPAWMRQAGLVSSRGQCDEAGCDARFHWLHADHHKPHSRSGATAWNNLRMLCSTANHDKADQHPNDWNYRRKTNHNARPGPRSGNGVQPPLFAVPPQPPPSSELKPAPEPDEPDETDNGVAA